MYKILPILIFAIKLSILTSQEINYVIDINNSVDFKKKYYFQLNAQFEEYKLALEKAMTEILGNHYLINIQYNIFESIEKKGDAKQSSVRDSLYSQSKIVKKKYNNENLVVTGVGFPLEAIALGELLIEIYIDEPVTQLILGSQKKSLKSSLISALTESYELLFMDLEDCIDCIVIKFIDIDKFKSNSENKQMSLNRNDIYDDSWAVIIGIDKYENLSNLDYAVADAEAVKDMLLSKFDYKEQNVKLLLNEEANKTNIVNVISDVSLKARENDRILVFYAGHGETMPLPDGGEMGYLVPIDGNQDNLLASAIPMDDLKRFSNVSKAKHMLFLVDACYGGLAAVGSRGLEPAKTPNYIEKITNIKSRQIITAGGKDEKVFEKSEWGHSAYTKNLLSALEDGYADSNGDGYITADELGDYLSEKVSIDSENQQTPQSRRLTSHEGEFIFIANNMEVNIVNNNTSKSLFDDSIKDVNDNADLLIKRIKYPYNLSMIYFARNGAIILHKKLSSQSGVGFAYFHMEDNYLGDYSDLMSGTIYENTRRYHLDKQVDIFAPVGYYYLFSESRQIFNPVFYFSLGFYNVKIEESIDDDYELFSILHSERNFNYIIGILNHIKIWKHLGISMGIHLNREYQYTISEHKILLEDSQWQFQPMFTIDILDVHNPFGKDND